MRWPEFLPWRRTSIRLRLQLLVVACVVPGWLVAMVIAVTNYQREHAALMQNASASAIRLMLALDSEVDKYAMALQMLATSPHLDSGDLRGFYAQALLAKPHTGALTLVLFDAQDQQILNLLVPFGEPLPAYRPLDGFPPPSDDPRPQVSDLFVGKVTGVQRVALRVPVLREGRAKYRLVMVLSVEALADFMRRQGLPPGWIASVVDSRGITAARTLNADRFVGTPLVPHMLERVLNQESSSSFTQTREGVDVLASHARSQRYSWSVTIGAPEAALTADLRQQIVKSSGLAAALLLAGLALATALGGSIARPIRALIGPARLIGEGRRVDMPQPAMREARELAEAMANAQSLLFEREQARDAAITALKRSESDLRLAIEASRMGTWDLDIRSGELRHSLQHDRCFGYPEAVADWSIDSFREALHPEDRSRVLAQTADAEKSGVPLSEEFRVLWPDGSEHWLAVHSLLLRDDAGQPSRMIGVVADITERKQGEALRLHNAQLEIQNREILEASRRKQEFLANVSHELRNPLNAVIGFADILRQGILPPDSPRHREYIDHIANGGLHLLQIVNDLLDLSKMEAGKLEFRAEQIDLPALVDETIAMVRGPADGKRLELRVELDALLTDLRLDPLRLRQVLLNFLSNAVKFTSPGGLIVVRAAEISATRWRLEVEDNGAGISEQDQARLFQRYEQVLGGASDQVHGTGLGLHVTRQLVELQGGSVSMRSRYGVGSVFCAELPRQAQG
ncbi:sensor histidine kinase [Roseateles noduli]|uniref:sensor histidine kinase n=1 Tax=Roseateles noduli TaxID=2052484 RepID=UPI003D65B6B7